MAFEKLKALKCFQGLHDRIEAGVPCEVVAKWVQDDQMEYLDVKQDSLVRVLYRYKEDLPAAKMTNRAGGYLQKKMEGLKTKVDELDALNDLYLLQMSRVGLAMEKEEGLGFPNSKLWRDVEVAKGILETSVRLKMELGLMKRAALDVNLSGTLEHEHKNFMDKLDGDKKRKIGAVAGQLSDAIKALISAQVDEQGKEDGVIEADFEVVSSTPAAPEITPVAATAL
jgi:hypothetical protein